MYEHPFSNLAKSFGGNNLHFVEEHEAPLMLGNEIHHPLTVTLLIPLLRIAKHMIGADQDQSLVLLLMLWLVKEAQLLLVCLCSEYHYIIRIYLAPPIEFFPPLCSRYLRGADNNCRLFYCASSRYARQGLASSTGKDNDSRSGSSVAKHLAQGHLLVVTDHSWRPQLDLQIRILRVTSKRVLLDQRFFRFNTVISDLIEVLRRNLTRRLFLSFHPLLLLDWVAGIDHLLILLLIVHVILNVDNLLELVIDLLILLNILPQLIPFDFGFNVGDVGPWNLRFINLHYVTRVPGRSSAAYILYLLMQLRLVGEVVRVALVEA